MGRSPIDTVAALRLCIAAFLQMDGSGTTGCLCQGPPNTMSTWGCQYNMGNFPDLDWDETRGFGEEPSCGGSGCNSSDEEPSDDGMQSR